MPHAPKPFRLHRVRAKPVVDLRAGFRGAKRTEAKRRVWHRDELRCRACGKYVDLHESHLDHIRPLADGGGNEDENLQTLCLPCSKAKTTREQRERVASGR